MTEAKAYGSNIENETTKIGRGPCSKVTASQKRLAPAFSGLDVTCTFDTTYQVPTHSPRHASFARSLSLDLGVILSYDLRLDTRQVLEVSSLISGQQGSSKITMAETTIRNRFQQEKQEQSPRSTEPPWSNRKPHGGVLEALRMLAFVVYFLVCLIAYAVAFHPFVSESIR